MKLRTTVGALLDAFTLTAPTLDRKGSSANLYLQASDKTQFLYLYSTNLVTETATKIKAEVEEAGETLVNPKKLSDGLSGLDKKTPVSLSVTPTGNLLKVQAGNVKFSLASSCDVKEIGDRMRAIPSKSTPIAAIPNTQLTEFTKRSLFCIPNDLTGQRASLAALKLVDTESGGEEAFATDGSIAVHVAAKTKQSKGTIGLAGLLIPSSALEPLAALVARKKGETVSLILSDSKNKLYFKFADGTHFGTLTLNSAYPNLKPIIDQKMDFYLEIPREGLKQSLSRASSFVGSSSTKKTLELEFSKDTLAIRANGDDSLSDQVAVEYIGDKPKDPIKVGMNIDHLLNIAGGSHSEKLTFGFASSIKPLVITDHEGEEDERIDIKYVVMGVRLGSSQ